MNCNEPTHGLDTVYFPVHKVEFIDEDKQETDNQEEQGCTKGFISGFLSQNILFHHTYLSSWAYVRGTCLYDEGE